MNRVPAGHTWALAKRNGYVNCSTPTVMLVESPRISTALICVVKIIKITGRCRRLLGLESQNPHFSTRAIYLGQEKGKK